MHEARLQGGEEHAQEPEDEEAEDQWEEQGAEEREIPLGALEDHPNRPRIRRPEVKQLPARLRKV